MNTPRHNAGYHQKQKQPLKGLLDDGVWRCNCEPRIPADRFQVKNGRQNHGRWFYTCQNKSPKGCGFFLWDDDAKLREARTLLSNSRTERTSPVKAFDSQLSTTQTETETLSPSKLHAAVPPSPHHASNTINAPFTTAHALYRSNPKDKAAVFLRNRLAAGTQIERGVDPGDPLIPNGLSNSGSDDDEISWSGSDEGRAVNERIGSRATHETNAAKRSSLFETPRKQPRLNANDSPGKRKRGEELHQQNLPRTPGNAYRTPGANAEDDVFSTPASRLRSADWAKRDVPGLTTPVETPTPARFNSNTVALERPTPPVFGLSPCKEAPVPDTELSKDIVNELRGVDVELSERAVEKIKAVALSFTRKMRAIERGRDVSRMAVESKNRDIELLSRDMARLEKDLEEVRAVIAGTANGGSEKGYS